MTSVQEKTFDEKIQQRGDEAKYTLAFSKAELEYVTAGLADWDNLSGKQRSERASANGPNKKLYKLCKRFYVMDVAGANGVEVPVLVEREKDGSLPPLTSVRRVIAQEDWYDAIKAEHDTGGHCRGRALEYRVNARYSRIPRWALEVCAMPLHLCLLCMAALRHHSSLVVPWSSLPTHPSFPPPAVSDFCGVLPCLCGLPATQTEHARPPAHRHKGLWRAWAGACARSLIV